MQTNLDAPVYDQFWEADPRRIDAHRLAHKYTPPHFPAHNPTVDPRLPVGPGPAYAVTRPRGFFSRLIRGVVQ